jgi:hypothetical protein
MDDDGMGDYNALMMALLIEGLTYTVAATFYDGYDDNGSYTLDVTCAPAHTLEPSAGILSVRVTEATLYSFAPETAEPWVFRTSLNEGDPYLWLFDADGRFVTANDDY